MSRDLFQARAGRLKDATTIAVLRMREAEHAVEAAAAAVRGGFEVVEITTNTPGATDAISECAARGDALVGVGTVLHVDQVKEAYDAGAEFAVTPVVLPDVVEAAHGLQMPVIIGASTPTEIWAARNAGADWVKVFPSESLGGPDYISHVLGPLDGTPICCTGGITAENYLGYLDAGAELVGFATAVFSPDLAAEGRYDELERRSIEVHRRLDVYLTEGAEE